MCVLDRAVDHLSDGVLIWELDHVNPFDYKKMRLRYVNKTASKMAPASLDSLIGMTIETAFPEWCKKGYPKRFVQAYFSRERQSMFEQSETTDGFRDGLYVIQCFPAANRQIMVTFKRFPKPITKSVDSYCINNLEQKTMMLLGNYIDPVITVKAEKKRSQSW